MGLIQLHSIREPVFCPTCKTKGAPVDTATVKCLLSVSLSQVHETQYYFCRDADCPVVYFAADGTHTFSTHQVREQVYQKDPTSDDVFVCYCFRYTLGDIRRAVEAGSADNVISTITAGIRKGQCACDWRNPQGDCCLGNVRALVKNLSTPDE